MLFLRHTGTTPKKKNKPAAAANGDKLADSVEKLAVDEPKVKSKNLNVLEELRKSGMKRMANFVVVGKAARMAVLQPSTKFYLHRQGTLTTARVHSWAACYMI